MSFNRSSSSDNSFDPLRQFNRATQHLALKKNLGVNRNLIPGIAKLTQPRKKATQIFSMQNLQNQFIAKQSHLQAGSSNNRYGGNQSKSQPNLVQTKLSSFAYNPRQAPALGSRVMQIASDSKQFMSSLEPPSAPWQQQPSLFHYQPAVMKMNQPSTSNGKRPSGLDPSGHFKVPDESMQPPPPPKKFAPPLPSGWPLSNGNKSGRILKPPQNADSTMATIKSGEFRPAGISTPASPSDSLQPPPLKKFAPSSQKSNSFSARSSYSNNPTAPIGWPTSNGNQADTTMATVVTIAQFHPAGTSTPNSPPKKRKGIFVDPDEVVTSMRVNVRAMERKNQLTKFLKSADKACQKMNKGLFSQKGTDMANEICKELSVFKQSNLDTPRIMNETLKSNCDSNWWKTPATVEVRGLTTATKRFIPLAYPFPEEREKARKEEEARFKTPRRPQVPINKFKNHREKSNHRDAFHGISGMKLSQGAMSSSSQQSQSFTFIGSQSAVSTATCINPDFAAAIPPSRSSQNFDEELRIDEMLDYHVQYGTVDVETQFFGLDEMVINSQSQESSSRMFDYGGVEDIENQEPTWRTLKISKPRPKRLKDFVDYNKTKDSLEMSKLRSFKTHSQMSWMSPTVFSQPNYSQDI